MDKLEPLKLEKKVSCQTKNAHYKELRGWFSENLFSVSKEQQNKTSVISYCSRTKQHLLLITNAHSHDTQTNNERKMARLDVTNASMNEHNGNGKFIYKSQRKKNSLKKGKITGK